VRSDAVTTSPVTVTAIGQSGYCLPFSQVKTISEQPPTPDDIKPRSAAAAGEAAVANPRKIADARNWPNRLRITAPKPSKTRQQEQKNAQRSNLRQHLTGRAHFA